MAARLIADGWEIPEIANHLIEHGDEGPFCEYTPEEETESEALLWLFQNKKKDFGDLGLSDPSPQEHGMKWGEAISLFLILWRPPSWTTSSTGSRARW